MRRILFVNWNVLSGVMLKIKQVEALSRHFVAYQSIPFILDVSPRDHYSGHVISKVKIFSLTEKYVWRSRMFFNLFFMF